MHASKYRSSVVKMVRAEAQSEAFARLLKNGILTEKEEEILRWGKNASGTLPKRLSTDKLKMSVYREATAVECLVGYLYASGNADRLDVIMKYLGLMPSG
jgi:ribonuclease-3 family protein